MPSRINRWLWLSLAVSLLTAAHAGETGSKVFYGTDAKQHEFPFVVYYTNSLYPHFCTGSLIDRRWVLTAAHCLGSNMTHVTLGDYIRPGIEGSEQVISIAEEIPYPDYVDGYFDHDIGLIRLAEPANIRSDAVAKISPLKSKSFLRKMLANEKSCRSLGWGRMISSNGIKYIADRLQKQRVGFRTIDEAIGKGYDYLANITGVLAVETVYNNPCDLGSGCFGDSGGPIVCKQRGKWVQTGTVSFGDNKDGCRQGIWGIANVQNYYSWIQSVITRD